MMNFEFKLRKINLNLNWFYVEFIHIVKDKFNLENNILIYIMIYVNNDQID